MYDYPPTVYWSLVYASDIAVIFYAKHPTINQLFFSSRIDDIFNQVNAFAY